MKKFYNIVKDICKKNNIKYTFLSDNWIIVLQKNNIRRFIIGYKFDLNSSAMNNIFDDKYGLFTLLKEDKVPVADYIILHKKYDREVVLNYFNSNNHYLVVKNNNGSCGVNVFKSNDIDEIYSIIDKILTKNYSVCLSPFYNIKNEYRIITLKGEIKKVYGKKRAIVVGDGKKSKLELLQEFNPTYFLNKKSPELNEILAKGEVYEYNWQFNLSRGSIPFEITDKKLIARLKEIFTKVLNSIAIDFGSIDIIELDNGELMVLECNSGVMMENYISYMKNGYEEAYKIYEEAILTMLNENK